MNHVLSLILSFLLFTFITNLPSNNAAPFPSDVLDTEDNPLTQGSEYYIFPTEDFDGAYAGGINLGKAANSKCPLNVVQNKNDLGIPVKFTIPESPTDNILTGTHLEIEFATKADCAESSKWLLFVDKTTKRRFVGIGGPEDYHGVETISGKFVIKKHGSSYSLGFCFDISGECAPLGLRVFNSKEGISRLVLKLVDDFPVDFYKDADVEGDKISNMR